MTYASRILGAALVALLGVGTPSLDTATAQSVAEIGPVTVVGGDDKDHAATAWAVEQFDTTGLALPAVIVEIHSNSEPCGGYDGVFRRTADPLRVDVCNRNRHIIVHELAHVWDHHTLTDDVRQEFMDLLRVTGWNDSDLPWGERGVEVLAEIITWGMHDSAVIGDADEMRDRVQAFELVTGRSPRHHQTELATAPELARSGDPSVDAGTWDEVH